MRSLIAVAVASLLLIGAPGAGCARAQEESPLLGKAYPDFTLERVEGSAVSLNLLIKGQKAIVFFFATWCPHCRQQLAQLAAQKDRLSSEGIKVVLVDIGEDRSKVKKFLAAQGIEHDTFLDQGSLIAEMYQVVGVPMLFFIAADGKVRYIEYGLPGNYADILK